MLRGLVLENFKGFGHRAIVPFAPITLIFGENSAGKSSIIQALLLLQQSLSGPRNHPITGQGDRVDLGTFRDFVYQHDLSRNIEITPLVQDTNRKMRRNQWKDEPFFPETEGIGVKFCFDQGSKSTMVISSPVYKENYDSPLFQLIANHEDVWDSPGVGVPHAMLFLGDQDFTQGIWGELFDEFMSKGRSHAQENLRDLKREIESFKRRETYRLKVPNSGTFPAHVFLDEYEDREEILEGIRQSTHILENADAKIYQALLVLLSESMNLDYVTWLPQKGDSWVDALAVDFDRASLPLKLITWALGPKYSPGPFNGLRHLKFEALELAEFIHSEISRLIYLGPIRMTPPRLNVMAGATRADVGSTGSFLPEVLNSAENEDLIGEVNAVLDGFDIPYLLNVHKVRDKYFSDVYGLQLTDKRTKTLVSMSDVGFGISQLLPIIVQSKLSKSATILIEQPEIHVHPRLQAELGTLFVNSIQGPGGNQFVIETHSEHLMRRIQRLIRTGRLQSDQVSVLYVSRSRKGSEVLPLELDQTGEFLTDWPGGFFEEAFKEQFGN